MDGNPIATITLSSKTLVIDADDGLTFLSVKATAGTVTITGTRKIKGEASTAQPLAIGSVASIASKNGLPIGDFTIDASAGTAELIAS